MSTTQQEEAKTKNVIKCNDIDEFTTLTEQLYNDDPQNTRYVLKFNPQKGKFELKTTNDKKIYKFTSDQLNDMKKLEHLNNIVLKANAKSEKQQQHSSPQQHQPSAQQQKGGKKKNK